MKKNIVIVLFLIIAAIILAAFYFWPGLRPVLAPGDLIINKDGEVVKSDAVENDQPGNQKKNDLGLPLVIPDGFTAHIYAGELGKARDIVAAPNGIIVASMAAGKVVYLPDSNNDNKADEQKVLLEGRYNPHGMAEYCNGQECVFYLAETDAVYRFDYDKDDINLANEQKIIDLPDDGGHYTRHVLIDEQEDEPRLLITVGSKCNVCEEDDWRRAKILVSDLDGGNLREYAGGLRNSVFMASSPFTGKVYATDMGRDWLGDDLPPEEVNIIEEGKDYGWPFCYGNKIHDTDFDKNNYVQDPCGDTVAPVIEMPAHSAPLGLNFILEDGFGEEYWHDLLVVQHGSWNRSTPIGYRVVRMKMDEQGNFSGKEDFLSGFLVDGEAWGRPADVLAEAGGKIYISDDKAGAVYLLVYDSN